MASQLSSKAPIFLIILLLIMIALVGALLLASRPEPTTITILPPPPTDTPPPTTTPAPLQVYVTGAVANPERVVALPPGSRVEAALQAAGGFTDAADRARVNLASLLRDGDHIHVPALGAEDVALPTPMGGEKLRLNSATQAELETLPGIGPVTAARIIEHREQVGSFAALEDLDAVKGIGPAGLEKLRDLVVFD